MYDEALGQVHGEATPFYLAEEDDDEDDDEDDEGDDAEEDEDALDDDLDDTLEDDVLSGELETDGAR